jgi:hypothetical protein
MATVNSMNYGFKPKGKFMSTELREILQEAIVAGIDARERATRRTSTAAKRNRREAADSCGWVWLEIDPKLLKHIHKLNISGIGTSYETTAIVDEFKLHLKDVTDHQRMSASYSGIEAAARVLQKHGINSVVESLAD